TPSGAIVELGEGIRSTCRVASAPSAPINSPNVASASQAAVQAAPSAVAPDLSQLSSMLKARWKGNAPAPSAQSEPLSADQIRTFKITKLDADSKKIEVELTAS